MKKICFALLMTMLGGVAAAQHFEWAKGYGSSADEGNFIVGSVADPEGNLYILGDFYPDAEWDGVPLMPFTPYGPHHDTRSLIVAKIAPSGEMLWRKVIHGNNNNDTFAKDIKMLGDTAIAFFAQYELPRSGYLYYLDTLYTDEEDFVHDLSGMALHSTNAYIVLDLDGNVLEDHTLYLTYLDRDGNDVMYNHSNAYGPLSEYDNNLFWYPSFDVDRDGNIYICRWTDDWLNFNSLYLENGDLSAVKFWVDHRVAGVVDIPQGARHWFPQLVKFSPHLDTVLGSRYLVQKARGGKTFLDCRVKCRSNGDIYVIWNIDTRGDKDTPFAIMHNGHNLS